MNSTAFQMAVRQMGLRYGAPARFVNALASGFNSLFATLFGYSLSCLYFFGPMVPFTSFGFWENRNLLEICSQQSRLSPEYWLLHRDDCETFVYGMFENFLSSVSSVYWSIILCYTVAKLLGLVLRLSSSLVAWTGSSLVPIYASLERGTGKTVGLFGALGRQVAPEAVVANHKALEIHYPVKVEDPVRNLGGADCVVQDQGSALLGGHLGENPVKISKAIEDPKVVVVELLAGLA